MATTSNLSCLAPDRPVDAPVTPLPGRYARMLPDLPPLECDDEALLGIGLAAAAPSQLAVAPEWRPELMRDDGVFGMAELLVGIGA